MDRREMFGALGALGAGFTIAGGVVRAADHADPKKGNGTAGPVAGPHAHFCGIHVAKKDPKFQLIAQHYCTAHAGDGHAGDDVFQCLLFDSAEKTAKLLGVEYIISDQRYRGLSQEEKKYWHPHTYEVLAGGLTAPGMTAEEEMKFMKFVLTTWGKTWHTWPDPKSPVPVGEPLLMWSLGADDQVDPAVLAARDRMYNVNAAKIREARVKEIGYEVPSVAFPKSLDEAGRQWTSTGDDKPTRKP
jgi:hypothetical protein